jgi:acyl carrier protein
MEKLKTIINHIRENKGLEPFTEIEPAHQLRNDLGLDSMDLAELTVRIENEFGVDVFEDGIVSSIEEIVNKINK